MTTDQHSRLYLFTLLLIGIMAISFSAIFVKWTQAPVAVVAMYRLLFTNLLLLPFLWKYLAEMKKISSREWILMIFSGAALGLHFLFWMGSLRYTTVASSTALMALQPIFVMIGAYMVFKQRTSMMSIVSMLIAILGAVWISWGDFAVSGSAFIGDLLAILGAFIVAVHMLLGQNLRSHISSYVYSFVVFLMAATVLGVYSAIQGYSFHGYPAREWGIFILLAIIPTLFGHFLFNWLLKYLNATTISMGVLGEPMGATILAYLLLQESITISQLFAILLLVAGVWLFLRSSQSAQKTKAYQPAESK